MHQKRLAAGICPEPLVDPGVPQSLKRKQWALWTWDEMEKGT